MKFDRFLKDLLKLGNNVNLRILPADSISKISKAFTQQEAYEYLVINGKYNKKN